MTKRQTLSKKRKYLASKMLAQKIGYLKVQVLPSLPDLPTEAFTAHRIIRPKDQLFIIQKGVVEIWNTRHDMLVTKLGEDALFGEMSLLGQTMLGTQVIAGSGGVTLGVMDLDQVTEWVNSNQLSILRLLGPRLARIEVEHYRAQFQTADSRLAALLLDIAGDETVVTGLTQGDLSDQLGTYRETVTSVIQTMKKKKMIEIGRKKIKILNKKALKESSEL
jgi:CRP/FNR family transcriptional regulator, cyclic AMP receptor protein